MKYKMILPLLGLLILLSLFILDCTEDGENPAEPGMATVTNIIHITNFIDITNTTGPTPTPF